MADPYSSCKSRAQDVGLGAEFPVINSAVYTTFDASSLEYAPASPGLPGCLTVTLVKCKASSLSQPRSLGLSTSVSHVGTVV